MKLRDACVGVAACCILVLQQDTTFPATTKAVTKMDFHEFAEKVKGKESFAITVAGASRESFFTGAAYVHYETVAFIGKEDMTSAFQILYHTQEDFSVIYNNAAVAVRYSQIRTCLNPSFKKRYARESLAAPRSEIEKSLRSILDAEDVPALLLVEYGLQTGKRYFGRLKNESYHLPPQEQGGKPQRREKTVLLISDRAFPNDCDLTPLYKGWSY